MNTKIFTEEETYKYYKKRREDGPIMFTPFSYECFLKSGTKKIIAKDSTGIRCMLLYLSVEQKTHLLAQAGDIRKLKLKMRQDDIITSSWEKKEGWYKTFVRVFSIRKEIPRPTNTDVIWVMNSDSEFPGFFNIVVYSNTKIVANLLLCKYLFNERSAVNLCHCTKEGQFKELETLLIVLVQICKKLEGDYLLVCDHVLKGCEKYCDDFLQVYRNKKSRYFFC